MIVFLARPVLRQNVTVFVIQKIRPMQCVIRALVRSAHHYPEAVLDFVTSKVIGWKRNPSEVKGIRGENCGLTCVRVRNGGLLLCL